MKWQGVRLSCINASRASKSVSVLERSARFHSIVLSVTQRVRTEQAEFEAKLPKEMNSAQLRRAAPVDDVREAERKRLKKRREKRSKRREDSSLESLMKNLETWDSSLNMVHDAYIIETAVRNGEYPNGDSE